MKTKAEFATEWDELPTMLRGRVAMLAFVESIQADAIEAAAKVVDDTHQVFAEDVADEIRKLKEKL